MKRILGILFSVLFLLVFVIAFYISNSVYYDNMLFSNKTAISVICYDETTETHLQHEIDAICEEYSTALSKYVFLDRNNILVYTTDAAAYPTVLKDGYNQVLLPMNNEHIRVMPMEQTAKNAGISGLYYIHTTDQIVVEEVISSLNDTVGKTEFYASYSGFASGCLSLLQELKIFLPVFVLLIVSGLITLFVIVKIAVSESKNIAILQVNGYSSCRIFGTIGRKFFPAILVGLIFSTTVMLAIIIAKGSIRFIPHFLLLNLLAFTVLIGLSAFVFFISVKAIDCRQRKTDILKGNTATRFFLVLQMFLKYAMLAFAALLLVSLLNINKELDAYMISNTSWFQTENIYRVKAKFVTNELSEKRVLELQSQNLYHELENTAGAFLISCENYDRLSSDQLVWEANTATKLYSSSGKSITVNTNYLERHPVLDIEEHDVISKLIVDDTVRNILVPISLKTEEEQIYSGFLADFKFQKLQVPKIYEREIGEAPPAIDENKLRINIIYVPDNLAYFSYDKDIMPENGNLIYDPIVVVDTGNIDSSFYFSWLTNSVFYESESPDPFSAISSTVIKYDLLSSFNTVEAIYNTRADEIQSLADSKTSVVFVMTMVFTLMVFFIYLLSHSYFEQNKYAIFVKYISGYSLTKICRTKLLLEIVLDVLLLMLYGNLAIVLFFVIVDIALTYGFSLRLYSISAQRVLKGGLA